MTARRALVLGGGGIVGVAWETGVLAGLAAGGVDVRTAETIVGTSAGSVVGASIARGRDPRAMLAERASHRPAPVDRSAINVEDAAKVFQLWGSFDDMTPQRAAQVGALALAARITPGEEWIEAFAGEHRGAWPERDLLVCATDATTGERRVFDRASGVELVRAIAASCCVPGLLPPVSIDGARYMDGQVASGTSADVALRAKPGLVLIVAPIGWSGQGIHRSAARQIADETRALEAAGASVRVVLPDDAAREHMQQLMDTAEAELAAAAGEAHGRALSAELEAWWT